MAREKFDVANPEGIDPAMADALHRVRNALHAIGLATDALRGAQSYDELLGWLDDIVRCAEQGERAAATLVEEE